MRLVIDGRRSLPVPRLSAGGYCNCREPPDRTFPSTYRRAGRTVSPTIIRKRIHHYHHHYYRHYRCVNKRIDTAVMQRSACILNNVHNIIITDPWPDRITFLIIDFRWVTRIDLEPRTRKWNHPAPLAATNRTEPRTISMYTVCYNSNNNNVRTTRRFRICVQRAAESVYILSST